MSSAIRLFVGNLPINTNEKDLRVAFSSYGNITDLDLKSKPGNEENKKNFAFITLSTSHSAVESCINHFSQNVYKGSKLYVTRARESFLERLERERKEQNLQNNKGDRDLNSEPKTNPKINLGEQFTPQKRTLFDTEFQKKGTRKINQKLKNSLKNKQGVDVPVGRFETDQKKQDADKKRMESIRKKRQEFKEKQNIIKIGLHGIDQTKQNKKVIFSDDEFPKPKEKNKTPKSKISAEVTKPVLFDDDDDDDSADEVDFRIKKQYEGKRGQKVLDLQSRYKSDKRFVLDERFLDNQSEDENTEDQTVETNAENVDLGTTDEKAKQLNILEDVLGVAIKRPFLETVNNKKFKSKLGMLRFDPTQPEHAKFLAPVEEKQDIIKKSKKKKKEASEEIKQTTNEIQPEPKPEVSKEQFYKISDTLKETIVQPTSFSLRSLFTTSAEENTAEEEMDQDSGFIPLETPKDKKQVRNPLDPGEKNPFMYDSSDTEDEAKEEKMAAKIIPETSEVKAVWKENLFFTKFDQRLKEGLAFFNKPSCGERQKERRELKFLMKKRMYNNDRKNQMFQKKIGGRKKSMKKSYRNKTSHVKK